MLAKITNLIIPSRNDRLLKEFGIIVEQINAREPETEAMADSDFPGKTAEFKQRLENGETLDDILWDLDQALVKSQ